ncbi:hypothetical protein ACHAWF_011613, partial [Thalassiosira exigua]
YGLFSSARLYEVEIRLLFYALLTPLCITHSQMASGATEPRIIEQRRCLVLAAIGASAEKMRGNPTLKKLLNAGLLVTIKAWLDDILAGKIGGMDLLLHLLSNIIPLPVTKEMVTSSRLGKLVSSVEKHKICVGSANEAAIMSRIKKVKEHWSASVKALKNGTNNMSSKRSIDDHASSSAKKAKHEGSSLSNLLKKVENTNSTIKKSTMSAAEAARQKAQERDAKLKERLATKVNKPEEPKVSVGKWHSTRVSRVTLDQSSCCYAGCPAARPKKDERRIHWADSSGQSLALSQGEQMEAVKKAEPEKTRQSRWSDHKKKDIQHEKEMLLQSRKVGSVDEDKEDMLNAMAMMAMWKPPQPLPEDKQNPPVQVASNEIAVQMDRTRTISAVRYSSENEVPISPTLLSEVEKALELSSRNASAPQTIPFFTPQAVPAPAETAAMPVAQAFPPQAQPNIAPSSGATLETVLMLGLPLFLVGSNVQALQTLASNPGLLESFKDAHGQYVQPAIMNLVQSLTQNVVPQASPPNIAPSQPTQMTSYVPVNTVQSNQTNQNYYQQPSSSSYAQPQPVQQPATRGYRGDQNLGDANLHLSGYGPTTTNEEIIAMFAPYVHVTEVVNKNGFSFVNTSDPEGAKRAKEALSGSLLGGMPCRINPATRKARNPNFGGGAPGSSSVGLDSLPRNGLGQVDFAQVKDDRGNPATKNLFVAGYGPGTTEQQLKELFGQHATVVSVIMKGTFSFVNSTDKDAAVIARASLNGYQHNGGALRINFAKETGRLGTSFDSTYGPASSSSYGRY